MTIDHLEALVPRVIVIKYEVNPFTNKEVMSNVKVLADFDLQGQGHLHVNAIYCNS